MDIKMISEAALNTLELLEGIKYKAYQDQLGQWTIGLGHLIIIINGEVVDKHLEVVLGRTIDISEIPELELNDRQIDDLACLDTEVILEEMIKLITRPVTQHQIDALVSFIFNMGIGTFIKDRTGQGRTSVLDTVNNAHSGYEVGKALLEYSTIKKAPSQGRLKRRFIEASMFNCPEVWELPATLRDDLAHEALNIITRYKVDFATEFHSQ